MINVVHACILYLTVLRFIEWWYSLHCPNFSFNVVFSFSNVPCFFLP